MIRRRFPTVSSRPAITVLVGGGDYYFGAAGPDHLRRGTSYSGTALARFGAEDSGSTPETPITYTAAPAAADSAGAPTRFIGGLAIAGLGWAAVPAG